MDGARCDPVAQICTSARGHAIIWPSLWRAQLTASFHSCAINEVAALRNRVIQVRKVQMCDEAESAMWDLVKILGKQISKDCEKRSLEPFGEYVKTLTGARRDRYQRALDEMDGQPLTDKWATAYLFVKVENFLPRSKGYSIFGATEHEDECPDPRAIQAASDQLNLGFRQFVGPIEKTAYADFTACARRAGLLGGVVANTFGKGKNQREMAQLLIAVRSEFIDPVTLSVDASRADAHLHRRLHDAKFFLYGSFLWPDARRDMMTMKDWYYHPRSSTLKGTRYDLGDETMLRSGYMDTSLANNTCFFFLHLLFRDFYTGGPTYHRLKHLLEHTPRVLEDHDYQPLVNGDDTLPIVEKRNYLDIQAKLPPFFALFGVDLRIEGEATTITEESEWCQGRPINLNGQWSYVRNPLKVISTIAAGPKLWIWDLPRNPGRLTNKQILFLKKKVLSNAICEKVCSPGVPVIQALCDRIIELCHGVETTFEDLTQSSAYYRASLEGLDHRAFVRRSWMTSPEVTMQVRESFELAFGWSIGEQLDAESHYRELVFPAEYQVGHLGGTADYSGPPSGEQVAGIY